MAQGGALGIYGDFLFSDNDRFWRWIPPDAFPARPSASSKTSTRSGAPGRHPATTRTRRPQSASAVPWRTRWRACSRGRSWVESVVLQGVRSLGIWWNIQESINPAALRRLREARGRVRIHAPDRCTELIPEGGSHDRRNSRDLHRINTPGITCPPSSRSTSCSCGRDLL